MGEITLSDAVFGIKPNAAVMHAAVVNYLANQRQGTQSTLTRTEVSGGRQKAVETEGYRSRKTGLYQSSAVETRRYSSRAEAERLFLLSHKKVKRLALKSALSDKVHHSDMIVLTSLKPRLQNQGRCRLLKGNRCR